MSAVLPPWLHVKPDDETVLAGRKKRDNDRKYKKKIGYAKKHNPENAALIVEVLKTKQKLGISFDEVSQNGHSNSK